VLSGAVPARLGNSQRGWRWGAAQVVQDRLGQRHPAFPVALADHPQHAMGRVDRRDLERGGLADPQAAGVHQREARLVDGIADRAEEAADLGIGQGLRQPLLTGLANLFFPNSGQSRSSVRQYRKRIPKWAVLKVPRATPRSRKLSR
jgi:hypothetical protein